LTLWLVPLDEPFSSGVCTVIRNTPDHIAAASFIFHPESMCFSFSEEAARRNKHQQATISALVAVEHDHRKKGACKTMHHAWS
tara:strand:+ start:145 stop:393 length:249 start_codon:yes stop_codon:yes gene_type:complete